MTETRPPAYNPYYAESGSANTSSDHSFFEKIANAALAIIAAIGNAIAYIATGVCNLISSIFSSSSNNSSASSIEFQQHAAVPSAPPWDPAWGAQQK